jgi:hypothetical protein
MMVPDRHWWRTADGRLVPHGHPDALFLAYAKGIEVPDHLAEQIGLAPAVRAFARADVPDEPGKQASPPADKMSARPADKSGSLGGSS